MLTNFTGMINMTQVSIPLNSYVTYVLVKIVQILNKKYYSIPNTILTLAFIEISPASIGVAGGAEAILFSA